MYNNITIEDLQKAVMDGCKNKTAIKDYLGITSYQFNNVLVRLGLPQDSNILIEKLSKPAEPTFYDINTLSSDNIVYIDWEQQRRTSIRNKLIRIKIIQNMHGFTPVWADKVYADAIKYNISIDDTLVSNRAEHRTFLNVSTIDINEGE